MKKYNGVMANRFSIIILTLLLFFSAFAITVSCFVVNTEALTVTRDDGTWLFPVSSSNYDNFTDWAGCPGYGKCSLCGVTHNSAWGDGAHNGQAYGHNGIDLGVKFGTSVMATADGYVYYVETNWESRGYTVVMEHKIGNGWSYYSVYQHLSQVNIVKNGTHVSAGTVIAKSGQSGGSANSAVHLHFAILMAESGLGASVANMKTGTLSSIEGNGWVLNNGYTRGRILNNPAAKNDAGYPTGLSGVIPPLKAHYGSVHYTFDPTKVDIGVIETQYTEVEEAVYYLRNMSTGSYLSVDGGADVNAQNVSVSAFTGGNDMRMRVKKSTSTDGYSIQPLCTATRMINVHADAVSSGKNVDIWNDTGDASQRWGFEAIDGGYVVRCIQNPSCVLTVSGTNVLVENYTEKAEQKWELVRVSSSVQYDPNGVNVTDLPPSQTKMFELPLVLSTICPSRVGYTFVGWSEDKSSSAPAYQPGDIYTIESDLILYAVWKCDHAQTVMKNSQEATCHIEGYTGDIYCVSCDEKMEEGKKIPRLEHIMVHNFTIAATCIQEGKIEYVCDLCGDVSVEIIVATGLHSDEDKNKVCDICEIEMSVNTDTETQEIETPSVSDESTPDIDDPIDTNDENLSIMPGEVTTALDETDFEDEGTVETSDQSGGCQASFTAVSTFAMLLVINFLPLIYKKKNS